MISGARISRPPAYRVSVVQAVILLLLCVGLAIWNDVVAYSALLGGLINVVPQAWFAHKVFARRGARAAQQIASASYAAEVGKFVLAITGFALVFALVRPLEAWAVFAAYSVMLVIQVIGAWYLLRLAPPGQH